MGTPTPDALCLDTGWPDDRRAVIERGHALYEKALFAFERQGGWSDDEHETFWTGFDWPRSRGKPPTRVRTGDVVAVLDSLGFTREEIASEVLYVTPESLRTHDLHGVGEDMRLEDRRRLDGGDAPRRRGPWVHAADEDREYVVVPTLDAPDWHEGDELRGVSDRAFGPDGLVKRAFAERRLCYVGSLIARVGPDGRPQVAEALERLRGDLPDDVIADAQRRGKLPYTDGQLRRAPDDLDGLDDELAAIEDMDVRDGLSDR
jgi:hypothetical protein